MSNRYPGQMTNLEHMMEHVWERAENSRELVEKKKEFARDYRTLCRNHGFFLESEDPYCGLEILPEHEGDLKEY